MADEEDEEVILKGSDLYKHLKENCDEEFETFDKTARNYFPNDTYSRPQEGYIVVPSDLIYCLDILLNSNILLDDDATYLYTFTNNLVSTQPSKSLWSWLFSGSLIVSATYLFTEYHSVINSSMFHGTFSAALNTHMKQKRKRILQSLVIVLQQTTHMFKKTVQIVNEESARLQLQELKMKSDLVAQDFKEFNQFCALHRKEMELEQLKNVICHYLYKHIEATIVMTHSLVKVMPLMFVDSTDHSMADMVQNQLSLNKISNDPVEDPKGDPKIPSLEALKNLYFLLNSGMMRRLGLCFCPVLWKKEINPSNSLLEVIKEVEVYLNKCRTILSDLRFYYKKNGLSEYGSKKKNIDYNLVEGYSLVHKICVSSRNLVSDSSSLELFVEEQSVSEVKVKWVLKMLDSLKKELKECLNCIENAEKFYKKNVCKEKPKVSVDVEQGKGGEEKSLQLGEKNTLMGDEDEVYFGLTEGKSEEGDRSGDWDEPGPQFPDYLITELKQTLVGKKTEFDERELKAVKNDAEYLRFLEEPPQTPPQEEVPPELMSIPQSQFELHKLLALNAASKSSQFMKINEECFGSDDDLSDGS